MNNLTETDLLAPWTYESQAFLDIEIDTLFKPSWLLVGHECDLPSAGDYLTFEAFKERVLVVRNKAGEINAFHNVCRHRGGRLVIDNAGNCEHALTCPFHGWSYSFDGALRAVPAANTFKDLNKSEISLATVELEIWMGFIFIRFQAGGESLAAMMAPIADEIAQYKPAELQTYAPASVELKPFNWKAIHDIDNEGYHVPVGHPALHQLYGQNYSDANEGGIQVSRGYFNTKEPTLWSVKNYVSLMPKFDHLPADKQHVWYYFLHFPNLIFAFYPDMMEIYMTIPETPTSTRYVSRTFALPDDRREVKAVRYLNTRINNETAEEDDSFVGWLQDGMRSSAWTQPILSELESNVRDYHRKIQSKIPVAKLAENPGTQNLAQINDMLAAKAQKSDDSGRGDA
ncbi:MAG: aromatic ring-hydroxylating dioxygenase subunit alpha [Granulosicoccaceae bacterium]